MARGLWFVAGTGAGIYLTVRARRAAEAFTPDGLRDRWAAIRLGAHMFGEEVRTGMVEKEQEYRERFGVGGPRALERGGADTPPPSDAGTRPAETAIEGGGFETPLRGSSPNGSETPHERGGGGLDTPASGDAGTRPAEIDNDEKKDTA